MVSVAALPNSVLPWTIRLPVRVRSVPDKSTLAVASPAT